MQNRHWTRKWATRWPSDPAPAHGGGELGEVAGGVGGDRRGRFLGAQLFRVGEHPAQELADLRVGQLLDADFARLVGVAGEGGVDDDALAVADDEQRRVVELQEVVGELLERGGRSRPGFLFSQPKRPRIQTSAQPSPPPDFLAPRSKQ